MTDCPKCRELLALANEMLFLLKRGGVPVASRDRIHLLESALSKAAPGDSTPKNRSAVDAALAWFNVATGNEDEKQGKILAQEVRRFRELYESEPAAKTVEP